MGYVGPAVVRHLRRAHPRARLAGFDTGYFANCLTSAEVLPECRLDLQHFGDVRNFPKEVLGGVDAVVHLAAISNDPMGASFEAATSDINHRASVRVAELAKAAGVRRFVFASSCSVYGLAEGGPRRETDPVNPLTAYAKSKVLAERDLSQLADEAFQVTSLRFATACGMSERLRLDLVLNDFVASAVALKRIEVLSDGTPWRPLIAVADMARAIEWAVARESGAGGGFLVVNAGSDGWNFRIGALAEAVAGNVPGTDLTINRNAPPDKRSYRVDFSLFRKLAPDHQPLEDLPTTIDGLSTGLKAMGFNDPGFRDSHLSRLKVLQMLRGNGLLTHDLAWRDGPAPG
jgi:nucleoside-diphosphate-sugar epimerase